MLIINSIAWNECNEDPYIRKAQCEFLQHLAMLTVDIQSDHSSKWKDLYGANDRAVYGHLVMGVITLHCIFFIREIFPDPYGVS